MLEVDGKPVWDRVSAELMRRTHEHSSTHYPQAAQDGFGLGSQLAFLLEMGIERAHLYPTLGLMLFAVDVEPALAAALVRAYNDWLRALCAQAPGVLRGVGAVCRHEPAAMVEELRRVAGWGWRTVTVRPEPVAGRSLSHPDYEPFWAECARLGVAVSIHGSTHARVPTTGANRFDTRFGMHACSHPMELMLAVLTLIEGGVLERHPTLRVAFLEGGCSWLPFWLWRLDNQYADLAWEVEDRVRMKPSEYFRRQCFISCEPGEPGLEEVVKTVGEGCLLYGSDYPHMDHVSRVRQEATLLAQRLSPEVAQRILWDNASRYYGPPSTPTGPK
jgi:predicted TIM-barrel fold metal-dependent hydrolase